MILLLALKTVTSLNRIQKKYLADHGEPGEANFKKGKSAEHLIIPVNLKRWDWMSVRVFRYHWARW